MSTRLAGILAARLAFCVLPRCHPERSEGPAFLPRQRGVSWDGVVVVKARFEGGRESA